MTKNKVSVWNLVFGICLVLGIWCLGFSLYGCASTTATSTTTTTYTYPTATLTHLGFDFATGTRTNDSTSCDGEIINWAPDPSVVDPAYPPYDQYVWWRSALNYVLNDGHDYAHNSGSVELSSVMSVPTSWPTGEVKPLLPGYVWVIKCTPEGYAKFKVTAAGTDEPTAGWYATVEYYYTSEATFKH